MQWIEVKIATTTKGIEPVSGILLMNGITGYAVEDREDFVEFLADKSTYWDYIEDSLMSLKECETKITFYVAENNQGHETLAMIKNALSTLYLSDTEHDFGELSVTLCNISEEDWENNWKQYFKPLPIGKNLLIKPTWEEIPENYGDKIILELDPSSSFGTGSHMTTRLCLEAIEEIMLTTPACEILDMGCGSGILGIGAKKLGATHVTAVDIDENSVRIAKENAAVNKLTESDYTAFVGSITNDEALFQKLCEKKYDLIAANIVADVIMWMAPYFVKLLSEKGNLIVSGIIAERSGEVLDALKKAGFQLVSFTEKEAWACAILTL